MSPKEGGAPWSGSNGGGGEFGEELKRAHEHQNSKMAAETAAAAGAAAAAAEAEAAAGEGAGGGERPADSPATTTMSSAATAEDAENRDPSEPAVAATAATAPADDNLPPPTSPEPPAVDNGGGMGNDTEPPPAAATEEGPEVTEVAAEDANGRAAVEGGEEEMAELEPGKVRVRALYDYEATQDGDLSFGAGDMIITDGGAFSGDGWVSGTCHGNTGIFPANYTEPW